MVSWDQPFFDFCDLSRVVEKPTLKKNPRLGWKKKRTAVLQGGPLFMGGVIPEGQVPTWGLSPWWCVTRECSRRSVGELQLFVSSDCSLWKAAITQPTLTAAMPVCHRQLEPPGWPFWTAGLLSGLLCHGFGILQLYEGQQWWQAQTALVQLGALVCIPWLLGAALSSRSNRAVGSQLISQVAPDVKPRAAGDSE